MARKGKLANFGGKRAAPFKRGGGRRTGVTTRRRGY